MSSSRESQQQRNIREFMENYTLNDPSANQEVDLERIRFILKHRPAPPVSELHFNEITEEVIITKRNKERIGDCTICCFEFPLDTEAIKLPCKHYFHFDCITQWLCLQAVCPNCRHCLPSQDFEYDQMKRIVDKHDKKSKDEYDDDEGDRSYYSRNSSMYS